MKLYKIYRYVFIASLLLNNAIAQPPLRLIIQFEFSLSAEQQLQVKDQLNLIFQSEFSILDHSSDDRWIIRLKPDNKLKIEQLIKEIKLLQSVKYVEPDEVLSTSH